jgi:hypothetical protein
MFPVFHVQQGGGVKSNAVFGTVTKTTHGRENWVGDGWIGFLKHETKLISGRWQRHADQWIFEPDNPGSVTVILASTQWEILDGYWGERAAVVLDETRQWHKKPFTPTNAVRYKTSTDGERSTEIIKNGWDHEHCGICWETIGPRDQGYLSGETWICERCYSDFVQRRSLEFIPSA